MESKDINEPRDQRDFALDGDIERRIDADSSQVQLWIVPTNEEIIVARQTVSCVTEGS